MPRTNSRPEIIYVKDLSEEDKDNFELILKMFNTTNNGKAMKMLLSEFIKGKKLNSEMQNEIESLKNEVLIAKKEKATFLKDLDIIIRSISNVENQLKFSKKELTQLQ